MRTVVWFLLLACSLCTLGQNCDQKRAVECLVPKMDAVNSAKQSRNIAQQCTVTTDIILCLRVIPNCVNKSDIKQALDTLKELGCPGFGVKSCVPSLFLTYFLALILAYING